MANETSLVPTNEYRLSFLRKFTGLTEEESKGLVDILTQPTDKSIVRNRPIRGGGNASYVPGHEFIKRFNDAFGFLWSYEVPKVFQQDGQVVAQGRWSLQIPGRTITREFPDGIKETVRFDGFSIIKEQFGSAEIKKWASDVYAKDKKGNQIKDREGKPIINYHRGDIMDLGNDYKAAGTDAMKKCGTELGMFLDLYGPRESAEETGPSEKQLDAFYLRAGKCNMNQEAADKWATELLGKAVKEASQQEVLGLVADLIDLAKEQKNSS